MFAIMDANFVSVDDADVLIITGLNFPQLRIAFFTVPFPVFIVIYVALLQIIYSEFSIDEIVFFMPMVENKTLICRGCNSKYFCAKQQKKEMESNLIYLILQKNDVY